jgi:hypothetical protein
MTNARIAILGTVALTGCGEVDEGDSTPSCYSRTECAADEYCTFAYAEDPPAGEEPAAGSCLPRLAEGEPCEDGQCVDGLVCGSDPENVCVAIVNRGDPCDAATECADGLVCHQGFAPPVCEPPSVEGEGCAVAEDCAAGLPCEESLCGGPPVVEDPPLDDETEEGGGCEPSEDEAHAGAAPTALGLLFLARPIRRRVR